jgi:hypothetical protein
MGKAKMLGQANASFEAVKRQGLANEKANHKRAKRRSKYIGAGVLKAAFWTSLARDMLSTSLSRSLYFKSGFYRVHAV